MHEIEDDAQDENTQKHDDAPIKCGAVDGGLVRPERPEKSESDVHEADDIDGDAKAAETPARRGEEFGVVNSAVENAADGDGVREHKSDHLQGDDRIESSVRTDVDEGEKGANDAGEQDGVGGNLTGRVDCGDPGGKGKAIITSEGERLA